MPESAARGNRRFIAKSAGPSDGCFYFPALIVAFLIVHYELQAWICGEGKEHSNNVALDLYGGFY